MIPDVLSLWVEAVMVAALAVWMTVAVYDNWRHAALNREAVAMVMRFDLMERDYPDDFALVAHRQVKNPAIITAAFQIIRLAETLAAIALIIGAAMLAGAAMDMVDPMTATIVAVAATLYFSMIWAGFIVGGNFFHYYYCHQWGQSNHFMFMYWGFFVLVVLLI